MTAITRVFFLVSLCFFVFLPLQGHAKEIDWSRVAESRQTLFYPGVTSWEFLTSDDHKLGGREIKQGRKDCRHCHLSKEGELDLKADEIASGAVRMKRSHNPFEPEPVPGKKGILPVVLKAAYDDEFLYIRVEWETKGTGWKSKKTDAAVPDRVSMQINKEEPSFRKYGCFVTCHNDLNTMPESPSKKEVSANEYYKTFGRDDVRLYAYYTRDSWSVRKSQKELDKKLKEGGLIELWSIGFEEGKASTFDGWVFDDRRWEDHGSLEGSGSFSNGRYWAVFKTRLKSKGPFEFPLGPGDVVSAGMAIHEDGAAKRKHYVSFPFTIGLGANADVKASRVTN